MRGPPVAGLSGRPRASVSSQEQDARVSIRDESIDRGVDRDRIAAREVRSTYLLAEQRVPGQHDVPNVEAEAARGVARKRHEPDSRLTETDSLVGIQIPDPLRRVDAKPAEGRRVGRSVADNACIVAADATLDVEPLRERGRRPEMIGVTVGHQDVLRSCASSRDRVAQLRGIETWVNDDERA